MRVLTFTLLLALLSTSVFATQDKKQIKVRIQAQAGNLDEATLYFDQGINANYQYQEDAQKVFSGVAGVPVIYSVSADNIPLSINGFGNLSSNEITAIGIEVDADGIYTLTTPLIDNFAPTSIIRLEDRARGTYTDLRTNFYQVLLHASDAPTGRFYIHVSTPISVTPTPAGCLNNDGTLTMSGDNSITWTSVTLFDAFNNQVGTFNNVNGSCNFTGLSEGDYMLLQVFGSYTTTTNFHISGNYVVADIAASSINVTTGEDISFSAIAINTNRYEWDFGDGTLIMGVANPILSYYIPGVFTVNLKCSNSQGCVDNAQITVNVSQATAVEAVKKDAASVLAHGKKVSVELTDTNKGATMEVFNLLGSSIYNEPLDASKSTVSFDEQPMGFYVVSVKNGNSTYTKRVFLGE